MSTWKMTASQGFPWKPPSSLQLVPHGHPIPSNYMACWGVWGLEIILPCFIIIQGGPGHSPTQVAGPGIGQNIAEGSWGMVLAPRDKGSLQWHLSGLLGGEQPECPLQFLRANILGQCLELILDLLLDLDALLWPLCTEPSFPSQ